MKFGCFFPGAICAAVLALPEVLPAAAAQGLAGAYLAGNQAHRDNNYQVAAHYYGQALARDPSDPYLLNNALLAFVGKGDVDRAVALAYKVASGPVPSRLAEMVLLSEAIRKEDFDRADAALNGADDRFSPLLFGLLSAWVALGQGQMSTAGDRFDSMQNPAALRLFGQYHKALALASVGDFETADRILTGDENGSLRLNRGSLIAHAQIMTHVGKEADALNLLNEALRGTSDQGLAALRDQIEAGGEVDFTYIRSARDGTAEVFLTLAGVLGREENERYAIVYARLAEYLNPTSEAILLTAEVLREQGQYDLAARAYARVAQDDPMFLDAELGRADALVEADKRDAAIEVLRGLTRSHGDVPRVHMSLGDALRGAERYAEATEAYDRAVDMIPNPAPNHWFLFYARGITNERENRWDNAEADFRRALELNPDQPLVLNYLGYSLVEFGIKLEEAQAMIEKAVAQRPNDGYITDSLGWVLYRVGKFQEAVAPMERAVSLVPDDPIINDHLGDVYWMVGRQREARFQWRRALSFDPEEKEEIRIRRKLEVGLDAVLAEEKNLETASGDD
ncbi:MAG: tetratricopeptide repeat protein [Rhodobacteraceae bacterium]|nr:tetratricopeptide repeat protein [Paracoccaceae bacterium]